MTAQEIKAALKNPRESRGLPGVKGLFAFFTFEGGKQERVTKIKVPRFPAPKK